MSSPSSDNWRRRPLEVKVFEHCDRCQKLCEGVSARTHQSYWPTFTLTLKSCQPCFEIAKRERAAEYNVTIC